METEISGAGLGTFVAAAGIKQGLRAANEKITTGNDLIDAALMAGLGVVVVSATPSKGLLGFAGNATGCAALTEAGDKIYNWGKVKLNEYKVNRA